MRLRTPPSGCTGTMIASKLPILVGLTAIVSRDNFGEPGITDYRNPNLAEALRVLGFVQRYGVGIPTVRRVLSENGNPPVEFNLQRNYIGATVRPSQNP